MRFDEWYIIVSFVLIIIAGFRELFNETSL